jgi:hypothetical protein
MTIYPAHNGRARNPIATPAASARNDSTVITGTGGRGENLFLNLFCSHGHRRLRGRSTNGSIRFRHQNDFAVGHQRPEQANTFGSLVQTSILPVHSDDH